MEMHTTFEAGTIYGNYKVTGRTEDNKVVLYDRLTKAVKVFPLNARDTKALGVEVIYVRSGAMDIGCGALCACDVDFDNYIMESTRKPIYKVSFRHTSVYESLTSAMKQNREGTEISRALYGAKTYEDGTAQIHLIAVISRKR